MIHFFTALGITVTTIAIELLVWLLWDMVITNGTTNVDGRFAIVVLGVIHFFYLILMGMWSVDRRE